MALAPKTPVGSPQHAAAAGGRAVAQRAGAPAIDQSPRVVAQGERCTALFGAAASGHGSTAQRMVGVAKASMGTDLIETNSIKYALDRAGGPVGTLHSLDISKIPDGGSLYIVAHGNKTESGDYSSDEILGFLMDPTTGLRHDATNISIVFTSCHAGEGTTDPAIDSVSGEVAAGLRGAGFKGFTVSGARGLSLKSSATGDDFTVIDPSKESLYWPIQSAMLLKHKPKEKYQDWLLKNPKATFEERAQAASDVSRDFYVDLIAKVEEDGLNLPNQEAMSHHKVDDKGNFYFKLKNMGQSPFPLDIEDYGGPWKKLK